MLHGIPALVSTGRRDGAEQLSVLLTTTPGDDVRTAFAGLSPDGIAKSLFHLGVNRVAENADFVCVLAWLNVAEAVRLLGMKPESDGEVIVDERLHRLLTQALAEYNDSGSSARIERLLVMARPADLDAGEITDKGYVNQRKVLACRSALVAMLYADQVPPGVVVAGKMA